MPLRGIRKYREGIAFQAIFGSRATLLLRAAEALADVVARVGDVAGESRSSGILLFLPIGSEL